MSIKILETSTMELVKIKQEANERGINESFDLLMNNYELKSSYRWASYEMVIIAFYSECVEHVGDQWINTKTKGPATIEQLYKVIDKVAQMLLREQLLIVQELS